MTLEGDIYIFVRYIGVMFPGDSHFPSTVNDPFDYASRYDQMQNMIDIIGSPDESEIANIASEKARQYIRSLPQRKKENLKQMFPGADEHALNLFTRLLKFDMDKRISAKDAIEHPYLAGHATVTKKETKDLHGEYGNILSFKDKDLSMDQCREMILEEISMHEDDLIVNGYIRKYIEPALGSLPLDIVNLLCAVFSVML